jgi:uncharacterized protein (TIGR02145 family)
MTGVRYVGAFLYALCGSVSALDLSGKVLNLDSTGRGGVVVSLSGSGRSTVTESDGTWAILEPTSIKARSSGDVRVSSNLRIHAGRLRVDLAGRDLLGRLGPGRELSREIRPELAARSLALVNDTLVYSSEGRIFLRDTVGTSRSGIVRFYDTTWNAEIVYGYLTDDRDGQAYRTVAVRSAFVWMAQNLSFAGAGLCANGNVDTCSKYGRHYRWDEVMQGELSSRQFPSGVKGICPTGWHVPSVMEWRTLASTVDTSGGALSGAKLKSTSGWSFPSLNGTDVNGFRALPAGSYYPGVPNSIGRFGRWWTSTETHQYGANARTIGAGSGVNESYLDLYESVSLRCVKDFW